MTEYGERIANLRNKAGLTQAMLAFECEWTASRQSNYETGFRTPKIKDIEILGNALDKYLGGSSVVYLVTGKDIGELFEEIGGVMENRFSPENAIAIFKETISDAVELGFVKLAPRTKIMDLVRSFSKSCGLSLQSSSESLQNAKY